MADKTTKSSQGQKIKLVSRTMGKNSTWVARVKGISTGIYGKGENYVASERKTWDK
jgi:hypothetical protein